MKKANVAQSVHTRLLALARAENQEFNHLLLCYAMERFLVRLSTSKYKTTFTLKGAMLFRVWLPRAHRPTKDLDLLGRGAPDLARLTTVFAEVCEESDAVDGMVFDASSVKAARIKEDAEYEGVRVTFKAMLGSARLGIQVDVGFGDAVSPDPVEVEFPTFLKMPAAKMMAYRKETVVAEKLHAMVHLGMTNSRMKDFFDVWFLSQHFEFEGALLVEAIRCTFEKRGTSIPEGLPLALTPAFSADASKQVQWKAFVARVLKGADSAPLHEVVTVLATYLWAPLEAVRAGRSFEHAWASTSGWSG